MSGSQASSLWAGQAASPPNTSPAGGTGARPIARMAAPRLLLAALLLTGSFAGAGEAEQDWRAIVALDAGPQSQARAADQVRAASLAHLRRQEKALRMFAAEHPRDPRAFEAQIRLARALQIRSDFEDAEEPGAEAKRLLDELAKSATPAQRPELDFARIARLMRLARQPTAAQREELLAAARRFRADHPADRRVAALLVEVATLFDQQPKTKLALLTDAQTLARDDELKGRIADDLKRVNLVGKIVPLHFTSTVGRLVDVENFRGKPVLLIFFADFSPPSIVALATAQRAVGELPAGRVQMIGVSLDTKPQEVAAVMKEHAIKWPVAFDGRSWESPLARSLGINALPTVWLLDRGGRLRSLNALENLGAQLQQVLGEK